MRIVRTDMGWKVLNPRCPRGEHLGRLAVHCGYRVGELCQALGCGERYLHRVFLRDVGLPPKEWLRQERILVAQRLLTEGREPREVASALGFAGLAGLRRDFIASHGLAPAAWVARRVGSREPHEEIDRGGARPGVPGSAGACQVPGDG